MKYITTKDITTGEDVQLSYTDYGYGHPVVLVHGWPLCKQMWEYQLPDLVHAGLRCVQYDRRGFGASSKPWHGYDYDSLATDLHAVMEELNLHNAVLVGFSMGGGEVVRYLNRYGNERVAKVVLISSVTPYLTKNNDNPDGVDEAVFSDMIMDIKNDRIAFLDDFIKKLFGVKVVSRTMSTPLLDHYRMLASQAFPRALQQCAISFSHTDFRAEVEAINLPALVIHGNADQVVPAESSERTAVLMPHCTYKIYEDAPHGLFYTHKEQLNQDLLDFIQPSRKKQEEPVISGQEDFQI